MYVLTIINKHEKWLRKYSFQAVFENICPFKKIYVFSNLNNISVIDVFIKAMLNEALNSNYVWRNSNNHL